MHLTLNIKQNTTAVNEAGNSREATKISTQEYMSLPETGFLALSVFPVLVTPIRFHTTTIVPAVREIVTGDVNFKAIYSV